MSEGPNLTDEQRDQFFFMSIVQNFQQLAWGGLGKIANPNQEEIKVDLEQARWAIDMLGMLQRRTKGNLSPEEERELAQTMYTLQMNFVEEQKNAPDADADAGDGSQETASADEQSDEVDTEADAEAAAPSDTLEADSPQEPQETQ